MKSGRIGVAMLGIAFALSMAETSTSEAKGGGHGGGGHGGHQRPDGFYQPGHNYNYNQGDWEAYCSAKYRSFNPSTGNYRGNDGKWHKCG